MALCEHIFDQVCDEYDLLEPVMADYRQEGYFNPNPNLYPPTPTPTPAPTPTLTVTVTLTDYRQEGYAPPNSAQPWGSRYGR